MFSKKSRILAIFFLSFYSAPVIAATHNVTVGNNFFSPNDLTIEVGDTVRWTNNSGRTHDVTADDFSWASETSSSFTFERTFNSVEEVRYHCTVHSSPGQDINTRQNGRINVVQTDEPTFQINPGISDAWFYPPTSGQGFFVIVWPDIETMFLSWFTFDVERPPEDATAILGEPGHRWITAMGPYSGDTATLTVYLTEGGVFDAENPPAETDTNNPIGTMEVQFSGCNQGLVSYDIPSLGLMDAVPIERLTLDNVPACEAAQTP